MALLKLTRIKLSKLSEAVKYASGFSTRNYSKENQDPQCETREAQAEKDMPIQMKNPFTEEKPQCILCKYDIEPSYKNVRLLSQFTSRYTGKVYGRYITGLCKAKHKAVMREIRKAQYSGLMGVYTKDKNYLADPVLYDSTKPFKVI